MVTDLLPEDVFFGQKLFDGAEGGTEKGGIHVIGRVGSFWTINNNANNNNI